MIVFEVSMISPPMIISSNIPKAFNFTIRNYLVKVKNYVQLAHITKILIQNFYKQMNDLQIC